MQIQNATFENRNFKQTMEDKWGYWTSLQIRSYWGYFCTSATQARNTSF